MIGTLIYSQDEETRTMLRQFVVGWSGPAAGTAPSLSIHDQ
jgi:hypothetical protein